MDILLILVLPILPPMTAVWILRHGPFRNRWWRGESILGFALLIGAVTFSAGFFGPMILLPSSNQGPLLGILYTGPIGLVLGLLWGLGRAWDRQRVEPASFRKF